MTVLDEIEEFLSTIPLGYIFQTGWFKDELSKKEICKRGAFVRCEDIASVS